MRTALVSGLICALFIANAARAEPLTRVYINGSATPVFFNDGDSFRIQSGPFKGAQARLSGYNTLESFGAVHSWGSWTAKELYGIAKLATLTARRGTWHCEGDGKKDGYGRLLLFCKDLAAELIRRGLAHTYSVNEQPGDPDLLAVQREAMKAHVGMWAHGVPRFVMTSLHSKDEGGDKNGKTSNRLISTLDAHSDKWEHDDTYAECQKVCHMVAGPSPTDQEQNLKAVLENADAKAILDPMQPTLQKKVLDVMVEGVLRGVATGDALEGLGVRMPAGVTDAQATTLLAVLKKLKDDGKLLVTGKQEDSCQVYVDFRRRFGGDRAVCLR